MNVFLRELKFYRKGLIFWCIGMVFLVWSSMVKYDTFQAAGESITDLIAQFPQSVQTIFGLTGFDLTKASGFFGVMFMYVALLATVHAVMIGAGIISKEERDRTSEFLFVKPVARWRVVTSKIMAGLANLIVMNIVTLVSSIFYVDMYSKDPSFTGDIITLMFGLFFLQLIFFFVGTVIAAVSSRPKHSASIAAGIMLFAFILTYVINFNADFDYLKYLTPFKYFDAKDILENGSLELMYVLISITQISVMTIITYVAYSARDLDV